MTTQATLLRGDHLARGRGPSAWSPPVVTFVSVQIFMVIFAYWETVLGGGQQLFEKLFKVETPRLEKTHAWLLFASMAVYHLKVFRWSGFVSHSDTLSWFSTVLVTCYHVFAMFTIGMSAYFGAHFPMNNYWGTPSVSTDYSPAPPHWFQILFLCLTVLVLGLEAVADQQLAMFKRYKGTDPTGEELKTFVSSGDDAERYQERVCRIGMWNWCRHPNYFWNLFPFAFAALVGGNFACFGMWIFIQVFWAYTQSMPALESYMAEKYGDDWTEYCRRVPSKLFPKF